LGIIRNNDYSKRRVSPKQKGYKKEKMTLPI
jgi:hypothetical protein